MNKNDQPLIIKTSPLIFVKRLVIIEIISLLILLGIRYILLSNIIFFFTPAFTIPSGFIVTMSLSILQVLIIIIAFLTWYSERYILTKTDIRFKRGDLFHEREIVKLSDIKTIAVSQEFVGKWFNYGTLIINNEKTSRKTINSIPNPDYYATLLTTLSVSDGKQNIQSTIKPKSLKSMLEKGENNQIEYKSSFQWDYKKNAKNKDLQKPIMKTIAAFMNALGGILLIGVNDNSEVLGLANDYKLLKRKNKDGFENAFTMAFKKIIGDEFRYLVEIQFKQHKNKTVAIIIVQPAPEPVYIKYHDTEEFYVRAGNSSQPLTIRQATSYIRSRFSQ